jgi:hypothetical protein
MNRIRRALSSPAFAGGIIPALLVWAVTAASILHYYA